MARRNQHSREELQGLAVQAVQELVAQHGLSGLSVRKVAEHIGYTVGMLYHVFRNLDELILHTNAAILNTLLNDMQAANAKPPLEALRHMGLAYLTLARHQTPLWQMVFTHRMQKGEPVPAWYQAQTQALFDHVEAKVNALNPHASADDALLVARTLWSGVHGIAVLVTENKLAVAGEVDETAMFDSLLTHYLSSWAKSKN